MRFTFPFLEFLPGCRVHVAFLSFKVIFQHFHHVFVLFRFAEPRSVSAVPDGDSGDDDVDYVGEMSEDQKMAMKELRDMRIDLAYTGKFCTK